MIDRLGVSLGLAAASAAASFAIAMALGTAPFVALLAATMIGCFAAFLPQMTRWPTAMALFIVGQNFVAAIIIRLASGNNLEGALQNPEASYATALGFSLLILSASGMISTRNAPLLPEGWGRDVVGKISIISLIWGIVSSIVIFVFGFGLGDGSQSVSGTGLFHKHVVFLYLPVMIWAGTQAGKRSRIAFICAWTAIIYCAIAMLLLNQRKVGFDCALAFALAYVSLNGIPRPRLMVVASVSFWLLFGVVSPVISYMRFDLAPLTLSERPNFILANLPRYARDISNGRPLPENVRFALTARYLDYAGGGAVLQRVNGVQITDFAFTTPTAGFTSDDPILFGLKQALPSVVAGEKATYSQGDFFTWVRGLRPAGAEGHPFVNALAIGVWAYGPLIGVLIAASMVLVGLALVAQISPRLFPSIWGGFFFVATYNSFAEGDIARLVILVLRVIPELGIAAVLIYLLARGLSRRPARRVHRPNFPKAENSGGASGAI